jgi:hypothetical protein
MLRTEISLLAAFFSGISIPTDRIFCLHWNIKDEFDLLIEGHSEGQLLGLAMHPRKAAFATCGGDRVLATWSLRCRSVTAKLRLPSLGFCCSYSADGGQLAVGMESGAVMIVRSEALAETVQAFIHAHSAVTCIKYFLSPIPID